MTSDGLEWHPGPDARDSGWAHVSGWMQLSGSRQHISCVLPTLNHAETLSDWLAELTDTLTEAGYPWELVVVDAASDDRTPAILRRWSELPGVRVGLATNRISRARAVLLGMQRARGDCALLLHAGADGVQDVVPQMIELWIEGSRYVRASADDANPCLRIDADPLAGGLRPLIDTRDFDEASASAILLARGLYAALL